MVTIVDPGLEYVETCDLCGGWSQDLLFVKEGFRHVRCRACGLVFVSPRLSAHLDNQKVSGTGTMGEESLTLAQKRRLRKQLATLEPFRRLNRLLEIGAGRGWFLAEAAGAGWETWAVEVNDEALGWLRKNRLATIIAESAEEFEAPDYALMDVVRIWDVIEHLRSPRKAMTRIHAALRPGGMLLLATTNFASLSRWINGPEWVYLNGSDHIFLFEPATITRLLEEIGFEQVRVRTKSFNLRRKLYHPELELPAKASLLAPFRKIIDETIRLTPYGHQMIVTARKSEAWSYRI